MLFHVVSYCFAAIGFLQENDAMNMEVSKFYATKSFQNGSVLVDPISLLPVVPHKAAAEVSRIGHYRRD